LLSREDLNSRFFKEDGTVNYNRHIRAAGQTSERPIVWEETQQLSTTIETCWTDRLSE